MRETLARLLRRAADRLAPPRDPDELADSMAPERRNQRIREALQQVLAEQRAGSNTATYTLEAGQLTRTPNVGGFDWCAHEPKHEPRDVFAHVQALNDEMLAEVERLSESWDDKRGLWSEPSEKLPWLDGEGRSRWTDHP